MTSRQPASIPVQQWGDQQENIMVPGGAYLCQVNESVSCGACCGLYNLADFSRKSLVDTMMKRTYEFAGVPREVSKIVRFGEIVCRQTQKNQPFPEFYHCPYVGLIGPNLSRIGCLLHPMAEGNNGIDYRGLSYYGGMACRIYFCPVNKNLPTRIKRIVRECFSDWYAYGLIITESDLIAAIFKEIETRLEKPVDLQMITSDALSKIFKLLILKLTWPFRNPRWPVVNYFFEDGKYRPPAIDYLKIQASPSRYHPIFQELGSQFPDPQTMYRAENVLDDHFGAIIETLPSC